MGRDAYQHLQTAELLYPLVAGLFLASSLALVLRRLAPRHPSVVALAAVALLANAFDYLENVIARRALAAFPDRAATNALLGFMSAAKTVTPWRAGVLLLAGIAAVVVRTGRWTLKSQRPARPDGRTCSVRGTAGSQ